ncbi:lipoprotein, partial [Streptomyces sp. NRRL S-495]
GGGGGGAGGGTICDQAEHFGRWPAGSEQARLCRGIYG